MLMETLVSIMVVSVVLLSLVYIQSSALLTTSVSKQREQATQLATTFMEQLRAMPYVALSSGLLDTDLGGDDPNIAQAGGVWRLRPAHNSAIDEELVTSPGQNQEPLVNHYREGGVDDAALVVGTARFSVGMYVTKAENWTSAVPVMWLTVVATRLSGPSPGPAPVALRSQVFSPQGCLSTSTRPYSGPCQAYFYGSAGTTQGRIWLDNDWSSLVESGLDPVPELGIDQAQLTLPNLSVSSQAEQSTSLDSQGTTSGAQATIAGVKSAAGLKVAQVKVDNDPSSSLPSNPPAASTAQSTTTLSATGTFGTLTLSPSGSGGVAAMAGMNSAADIPCRDLADAVTAADLPCASASLGSVGAQTVSVAPGAAAHTLGTFTLAALAGAAGSPGKAWTARLVQAQNGHCGGIAAAGTVGCSSSAASRIAGTLQVGSYPPIDATDVAPVGFVKTDPLVTLSGYSASGTSERGIGANAATAARGGSIRYWNGAGYSTVALTTAPLSVTLPTTVITYNKEAGATFTLTMGGSVSATAASTTTTGPLPGCASACTTKTEVPSAIVRITYDLQQTSGGVTAPVAKFAVNTDFGTVLASTSYRAAPS